jgi:hypothetical protein
LTGVQIANGLPPRPFGDMKNLKYFIGKGNNSMLIRMAMKQRWWWTMSDKEKSYNFIWTQAKQKKAFEKLAKRNLEGGSPMKPSGNVNGNGDGEMSFDSSEETTITTP